MKRPLVLLTQEEDSEAVKAALDRMRQVNAARRAAAICGLGALHRILGVLRENHDTGQPYKLRKLLFSLWNGKPADLTDTLGLDWELKQDFARVLVGFGYEDKDVKFFYRAISDGFKEAGLSEWFLAEGDAS